MINFAVPGLRVYYFSKILNRTNRSKIYIVLNLLNMTNYGTY